MPDASGNQPQRNCFLGVDFHSILFEGELALIFCGRIGWALRGAPVIHHSDLLNAGDGAHTGAWLFGVKLTPEVCVGVVFKWDGRVAALLRTVVN
jgi:hypothetical protein